MGGQDMVTMDGFRKRVYRGECEPVRMVIIKQGGGLVEASCGWTFLHRRGKVREAAAQRHLDKRHGGQGMWL